MGVDTNAGVKSSGAGGSYMKQGATVDSSTPKCYRTSDYPVFGVALKGLFLAGQLEKRLQNEQKGTYAKAAIKAERDASSA
jgi:hypothetical protein